MTRERGIMLTKLRLDRGFADDLAAGETRRGVFVVVSSGEQTSWLERDGEVSILLADRRSMTKFLVAAVRQTMTGPTVDLADFIPAPTSPNADHRFTIIASSWRR